MDCLLLEFDRGTVLCRHWPRDVDPNDAPGVRFDPRVGLHRAPGHAHAHLRAWLSAAGVPFEDRILPATVEAAAALPALRTPELRPYQRAALAAWELAGRRGVAVLPTGSGKTHLALAALASTRAPTLCLVPTRVLLSQWASALGRLAPPGGGPLPIGRLGDGQHDVRPITVATFEGGRRRMPLIGHRFALLVVDEAHHFGGGTRDDALELCTAPWRLGLTATPRAGEAGARLDRLLGPCVFERSIADLRGSFLADVERIELGVELSADEREQYERHCGAFRRAHDLFRGAGTGGGWDDFARWAAQTAAGRAALEGWRQARALAAWNDGKRRLVGALLRQHRAERTLVFTADNDAAYAIARDGLVMPITAHVARAEREWALAAFARGELRALVSARVLNEGLDVPAASVGIIAGSGAGARGGRGAREYVQRIGRLLRPGPGKRALVYELVTRDTIEAARAKGRLEPGPGRRR